MIESWQPQDGQELLRIEQIAQAQAMMWHWQGTLAGYGVPLVVKSFDAIDRVPPWGRSLTLAEKTEKAMAMIECWHAMYLRMLKAMGDLRKMSG